MLNIIGFEKQKKYFFSLLENGQLSHAYLFSGPEMIGKKFFSQYLYELANKREFNENDPDLKFISPQLEKGDTKIYIEDIRNLKSFIYFKPLIGPYKFAIINDADRLTAEASNSLLKILEEPPKNSIIILITSKPKYLLPTISSRCQEVRFNSHSEENVSDFLKNHELSKEDLKYLTLISQGQIGWIKKIVDEGQVPEIKKNGEDFGKLLRSGLFERMSYAKRIYEKEDYQNIVSNWISWAYINKSNLQKPALVLKNLIELKTIISQPQFNHRLALENFLVNLP